MPRRSFLALQTLEGRDVPAGSITALPISPAGLLTITGDDDANDVQILVSGGSVTLTSVGGTLINNSSNPVVLNGLVKTIKADFRGGADDVSIAPGVDFVVSGPVSLNLGDGDNILNLVTTGRIGLGGLTVTAADGLDTVTVQGGANSTIGGNAKFTYASGGSTTAFTGIGFSAVSVTAGDAITTPNEVTSTNVTVTKTFAANLGNSFPATLDFTGGSVGGVTATGYSVSSIMTGTIVTGGITFKTLYSADLQADGLTVMKNVALTAPNPNLEATGNGTTINGNLSLTGLLGWTNTLFQTTTQSEVKGNVTIKGGWFNDVFDGNALFRVGKNLSLTFNGGDNVVTVGDGTALTTVGGNLTVKTGAGNDLITLDRVTVTGAVAISAFAGLDLLSIENGSTFLKTFSADLGTGDDTIIVAELTGAPNAVTFTGKTKIVAGTGNDLLVLGFAPNPLDPPNGGDANSRVVFGGVGSVVDGGLGLNFLDDAIGQFTGVVPINW